MYPSTRERRMLKLARHELVNAGQKDAHLVIMYAREEAGENVISRRGNVADPPV